MSPGYSSDCIRRGLRGWELAVLGQNGLPESNGRSGPIGAASPNGLPGSKNGLPESNGRFGPIGVPGQNGLPESTHLVQMACLVEWAFLVKMTQLNRLGLVGRIV